MFWLINVLPGWWLKFKQLCIAQKAVQSYEEFLKRQNDEKSQKTRRKCNGLHEHHLTLLSLVFFLSLYFLLFRIFRFEDWWHLLVVFGSVVIALFYLFSAR